MGTSAHDEQGREHAVAGGSGRSVVRHGRAWQTKAAAAGAAGVSAYLGYLFVTTALVATGVTSVDARELQGSVMGLFAHDESDLRNVHGYMAAVFGFCLAAALPVTLGLWWRRAWSRDAAYGVFGLPGLVLTLFGLAGLRSDSPDVSPEQGLLAGLVLLAVAVLAGTPGAGQDFERIAKHRELASAAARRQQGRR